MVNCAGLGAAELLPAGLLLIGQERPPGFLTFDMNESLGTQRRPGGSEAAGQETLA